MAEEINDSTAYLMALRRSTAAAAGPARELNVQAGAPVAAPNAGEKFEGAEKRRSPRYKCEGSAELIEQGCEVRTWSTFTDIGLHGCYVEAQATYPAGAVLHMKLEANGIRVETKGKVRVSYPYLGMGVAFEEISEDNLVRLKQLLGTLARPSMIMGPGVSSPHPSTSPMDSLPEVGNPEAVVRALTEFFGIHQMLMRDDFVRLLKNSQK